MGVEMLLDGNKSLRLNGGDMGREVQRQRRRKMSKLNGFLLPYSLHTLLWCFLRARTKRNGKELFPLKAQ